MDTRPLVVVGHKNPDTDAVCAAIAYAQLKTRSGVPARPYRAGNINAQTKYVLERFGAAPPALLADVHLRISDIMIRGEELITLRPDDPVGRARDILVERRFSFLPVADDAGRCVGMFTLFGLAHALDQLRRMQDGYPITFYPDELLRRSGGWSAGGPALPSQCSGILRIPDPQATGSAGIRPTKPSAPSASIFLVPARSLDDPHFAADLGENDIVLAFGAPSKPGVTSDAPGSATRSIIQLPGTLVDAVAGLYEASPIRDSIQPAEPLLGSHDLVRRVEREINRYNAGGFIVTDDAGIMRGVVTRVNFLNQIQIRLVLVDHNELSQAVDGAEHAEIVEVIDHHRLGARSTDAPITFINKVVGSTCTIVAEMYRNQRIGLDRKTAGIMLSALLSDTVILKSPTTTDLDREMAPWLARLAGVQIDAYGEEMFAAGSELGGLASDAIIRQDQKFYDESGFKFGVSQIEMVGYKAFFERCDELAGALEISRSQNGLAFACLLATDITRESSLLLFAGSRRVADAIQYPQARDNLFEMHGVLSRKKQLLPYFLDLLKNL